MVSFSQADATMKRSCLRAPLQRPSSQRRAVATAAAVKQANVCPHINFLIFPRRLSCNQPPPGNGDPERTVPRPSPSKWAPRQPPPANTGATVSPGISGVDPRQGRWAPKPAAQRGASSSSGQWASSSPAQTEAASSASRWAPLPPVRAGAPLLTSKWTSPPPAQTAAPLAAGQRPPTPAQPSVPLGTWATPQSTTQSLYSPGQHGDPFVSRQGASSSGFTASPSQARTPQATPGRWARPAPSRSSFSDLSSQQPQPRGTTQSATSSNRYTQPAGEERVSQGAMQHRRAVRENPSHREPAPSTSYTETHMSPRPTGARDGRLDRGFAPHQVPAAARDQRPNRDSAPRHVASTIPAKQSFGDLLPGKGPVPIVEAEGHDASRGKHLRDQFKTRGSLKSRIGGDVAIVGHSRVTSAANSGMTQRKRKVKELRAAPVDVFIPSMCSVGNLARLLNVRLGEPIASVVSASSLMPVQNGCSGRWWSLAWRTSPHMIMVS